MTSWNFEFHCSNSDVIHPLRVVKSQLVDKNYPSLINKNACSPKITLRHESISKLRSVLLFWDKRSIQMASYLTQNDIAKFIFFLKVRHKFLIMIMVPRKIQVCHLDTSYRTKHSFLRAKISNPLHPVIWDSHFWGKAFQSQTILDFCKNHGDLAYT